MWPYYPDLLATPVPRYTSYPTAAEFGAGVDGGDMASALERVSGDVSLYVHIPFCEQICWYCGCNTTKSNRLDRLTSYLDALHREIALVGARLPAGARVRHMAFGGGSPNAISPTDFVRLMLSLTQAFALDRPTISIEIDPRSMSAGWAQALSGDSVGRYGGEEFLFVLYPCGAAEVAKAAERFRRAIAAFPVAIEDDPPKSLNVTISLGASSTSGQEDVRPEASLKQADDALYRSKADGRNRVTASDGRAARHGGNAD